MYTVHMNTEKHLFSKAEQGKGKVYYSIYKDIQGTVWIKFWGHFKEDSERKSRPWRILEYFGAEFRLEDYLCIPDDIIRENLSEIKQTIGDLTETEALYDMNHFFEKYCFPPLTDEVMLLSVKEITIDTPCGLYVG